MQPAPAAQRSPPRARSGARAFLPASARTTSAPGRLPHDVCCLVVKLQVVERELERLTRGLDESGNQPRNVGRGLTPVSQRVDLDQVCCDGHVSTGGML